ncbi:EamA family transporter RarD [Sphingomonas lenta]|uniref:Protein RarD n=1 Tax=Sphingomonas lenta TaxID=1141887 RepID=A0A2A2SHL3_9SPHN|nr:EamA family transporter RarD [Sphingomonas lenta]PAX08660.1 protein RarD [Sphingomonas lenta]
MTDNSTARAGLLYGVGAYLIWGSLPLYFKLLAHVPASQVLAQRVLWSVLLLLVTVVALKRLPAIRAAATPRVLLLLSASAFLIAVNWLVYIWAVANAHVLEASLGYFINPLINVALGMVVLRERVSPVQGAAVALAALGVLAMAVSGGGALWISLTLALSFGTYGLLRKVVAIDALGGLFIETLILAPFAVAMLLYAGWAGEGAFGRDTGTDLLLVASGVVTALPLLLFASAARRLPYATVGLLQYMAPSMAFLQAVLLFGEPLRPVHLVTFGLIWAGCGLYAWDSVRGARRAKRTPVPVEA